MGKNQKRYWLTVLILFGLLFSIIVFKNEIDYHNSYLENGLSHKVVNEDEVISDIYYLGERKSDFKVVNHLEISSLNTLERESTLIFDFEMISEKELNSDIFKDLLRLRHTVLFVGENVNPLRVHEPVNSFGIEFVPIEAPRELFYLMYGFSFNEHEEIYAPVFYASTDKGLIPEDVILGEILKMEKVFKK